MAVKRLLYKEEQLHKLIDNLPLEEERIIKRELLDHMIKIGKMDGFISWFLPLRFKKMNGGYIMTVKTLFGKNYILKGYADILKKFKIHLNCLEE
jgi:hypothetical protein